MATRKCGIQSLEGAEAFSKYGKPSDVQGVGDRWCRRPDVNNPRLAHRQVDCPEIALGIQLSLLDLHRFQHLLK